MSCPRTGSCPTSARPCRSTRLGGRGLPAAGLAHQRQHLALGHRERHARRPRGPTRCGRARDRVRPCRARIGYANDQVVDLEQRAPAPVADAAAAADVVTGASRWLAPSTAGSFRWHAARAPAPRAQRGRSTVHRSNARSHRGANGQPTIGRSRRGGAPGIDTTSSLAVQVGRRREQQPRVRVPRLVEQRRRPDPDSTISPAYITAARSQTCATTGRSCVTSISASPRSLGERLEQLQDLRLHHHVERGGGLVGQQHLGVAGQGHRDRRALAHAAGELVRVPRGRGRAGCPTSSSSSPARVFAAAPLAVPWSSIGSTICAPTVFTGLSAFIAPWKTIATSVQRWGRIVSSPPARMSSPSSSDAARRRSRSAAAAPSAPGSPSSSRSRTRRPGRAARPASQVEPHPLHRVQLGRRAAGRTRRAGPAPRAAGSRASLPRPRAGAERGSASCGSTGGRPAGAGSARPRSPDPSGSSR